MGYQSDYCDNEDDQLDAAELQSSAFIMGDQEDYDDDDYGRLDVEDLQTLLAPSMTR